MQATSLPMGADVYTSDNEKVGTVKEARGEYFRVQPGGFQHDYWLAALEAAADPLTGKVRLNFDKQHLKEHKQHVSDDIAGRPSVTPEHDPRAIDADLAIEDTQPRVGVGGLEEMHMEERYVQDPSEGRPTLAAEVETTTLSASEAADHSPALSAATPDPFRTPSRAAAASLDDDIANEQARRAATTESTVQPPVASHATPAHLGSVDPFRPQSRPASEVAKAHGELERPVDIGRAPSPKPGTVDRGELDGVGKVDPFRTAGKRESHAGFISLLEDFSERLDKSSAGDILAVKNDPHSQRQAFDLIEKMIAQLRDFEQLVSPS